MRDPYYDVPAISASGINTFYRTPLHYWLSSPFNPNKTHRDDTPAMVFGRLLHSMILTPGLLDTGFVVAPEINRRTNEGKAEYQAFMEFHSTKGIISPEDWQEAEDMRDALLANTDIAQLLGEGHPEKPAQWRREDGGTLCKAKLDYIRNGLVLDYKTTSDIREDELRRTVVRYGYHRQMAWYMEAAHALTGERPKGAVLIFQEKGCSDAIVPFALDADAIQLGEIENTYAYDEITKRLGTMDWRAYPPGIRQLSLPSWYLKQHGYN